MGCIENALCVPILPEVEKAIKDKTGKEFNSASSDEIVSIIGVFGKNLGAGAKPANLYCKGTFSQAHGLECPDPNRCREDILFNLIPTEKWTKELSEPFRVAPGRVQ